ncbi:uncharacterized protein LOC141679321 [Apium graveolens]|uniref:uncharacterized protein LOC141679321 n=1 Tax=Apium graveolens TaxID=4045 RepID=UPI003D796032
MNAFSSPLESVPLDYIISDISTIFVSNLWTWLALFCAGAASLFWRGAKSPVTLQLASAEPDVPVASLNPSILISAPSEPEMQKMVSSELGFELRQLEDTTILDTSDGVTKGKFVAYYLDSADECNDEHYDIGNGEGEAHAELLRWFKVDKLERMKEINEMGWYCNQDLTVLSGDIVRLWDDQL